jgi:nucleoside-diphosphate-sugar epimerase
LTQSESQESAFANKRILITGGLGFIGSNVARRLVDLGARVLLVDSLIPEYGGNLFNIQGYENRLTVNIADVRDTYGMAYLVKGQDYIFNLAGQTSHLDSMVDPFTDLEINCRSQLAILEACRKNNPNVRLVYASTRQIYGKPDYLPVDERHPLHPTDVNGINKMSGEWYHLLYNNVYGIRACALRLTNTYGPRMRIKDARHAFFGWWIRLMLEEREIEVYGDGLQVRDFNYVDDVVEAFLAAARHDECYGRVMNLGSHEVISLKDLAQLMVEVNRSGTYRLIPFPPDRKMIDIGGYHGDFGLIERTTGWTPKTGLMEGIAKTLDYYCQNMAPYLIS